MRTYDISLYLGAVIGREVQVTPTLRGTTTGGDYVTGIAKLAQKVLIELQTETGSCPDDPTRGVSLFTDLRQGKIRTEPGLQQAFSFATSPIIEALRQSETTTTPLDEQLTSLELAGVVFSPGSCVLRIEIGSAAGTSRAILLPTATLPVAIR